MGVSKLDAAFDPVAGERHADLAIAFDFGVLVFAVGEGPANPVEKAVKIQLATQIDAGLLHDQKSAALFVPMFVIMVLVMIMAVVVIVLAVLMGVAVTGQAVLAVGRFQRDADKAPVLHERDRAGDRFERVKGIRDSPEILFVFFVLVIMILVVIVLVFFCSAEGGGFGEAGNVEILRFPAQGLQLEDERSRAEGDAPGGLGPLIHARRAQIGEAVKEAVHAPGRNAAVQDIDHAADRITAIGDGRRPAQDFNAARAEHFAGHGMVRAGRRSVHGGEPVDENRDAILAQAADDGTARGRAEIARIHTGQSVQRIGDVAAEQLHQPLLGEHGHRADDLIGLKA